MSDIPLAEFRTDGERIEFTIDNSNGSLPAIANGSYQKIVDKINTSTHLSIEEKQGTVGFNRYVLNNGEVIELTTDNKTVLLNGVLLDDAQKKALFEMINSGRLKIVSNSNESRPIPIVPASKPIEIKKPESIESKLHQQLNEMTKARIEQKEKADKQNSISYDSNIEHDDYKGVDNPEFTKELWYFLKYGVDRNAR